MPVSLSAGSERWHMPHGASPGVPCQPSCPPPSLHPVGQISPWMWEVGWQHLAEICVGFRTAWPHWWSLKESSQEDSSHESRDAGRGCPHQDCPLGFICLGPSPRPECLLRHPQVALGLFCEWLCLNPWPSCSPIRCCFWKKL